MLRVLLALWSVLERLFSRHLVYARIERNVILTLVPLSDLTLDLERAKLRAGLIEPILRDSHSAAILVRLFDAAISFFVCLVVLAPLLGDFREIRHRIDMLRVVATQALLAVICVVRVLQQLIVALRRLPSIAQLRHIDRDFTFEFWKVAMDLHSSASPLLSFRSYLLLDFEL